MNFYFVRSDLLKMDNNQDRIISTDIDDIFTPTFDQCIAFYDHLLLYDHGRLVSAKDHYELKRRFEQEFEKDLHRVFREAIRESYMLFFEINPAFAKIDRKVRIMYHPSENMRDTKYKYHLGVDKHLYGWNLIGKEIEKMYYGWNPEYNKNWVFIIHHCIRLLIGELKSGKDIIRYAPFPPVEILRQGMSDEDFENLWKGDVTRVYQQFIAHTLEFYDLIIHEFEYPGNLVCHVRKMIAPFYNFHLDYQIRSLLFNSVVDQMETRSTKIADRCSLRSNREIDQKILSLYARKRLPLSDKDRQVCQSLVSSMWSDKKVLEAISYLPSNSITDGKMIRHHSQKDEYLLLSEDNEPISPLRAHSNLYCHNYFFPCILHLIYYKILLKCGMEKKMAYSIICQKISGQKDMFIDFTKCDVDYQIDKFLYSRSKKYLYNILFRDKIQSISFCSAILKVFHRSNKSIRLYVPYDDFLTSNEYGNIYEDVLKTCYKKIIDTDQLIIRQLRILLGITTEEETLTIAQQYLLHFTHAISILFGDLGWSKNLKCLKDAFKIIYPSVYIMYTTYYEKDQVEPEINYLQDFDQECNTFFHSCIRSLVANFHKGMFRQQRKRNLNHIVKKVSLLYYFTDIKTPQTLSQIGTILDGKSILIRSDSTLLKDQYLRNEIKKCKIKDSQSIDQMLLLIDTLYHSPYFRDF